MLFLDIYIYIGALRTRDITLIGFKKSGYHDLWSCDIIFDSLVEQALFRIFKMIFLLIFKD